MSQTSYEALDVEMSGTLAGWTLVAARCMLRFLKSQASPEALDVEMSWTLAGWTLGSAPRASMHE